MFILSYMKFLITYSKTISLSCYVKSIISLYYKYKNLT